MPDETGRMTEEEYRAEIARQDAFWDEVAMRSLAFRVVCYVTYALVLFGVGVAVGHAFL